MWTVNNTTPFEADRTWVRDRDGRHVWVVVVKATYAFEADAHVQLADEQVPVLAEPEYRGQPGESSLRYDADLAMPKPGTDVVVNASAHAPGGRPVQEVAVELRVADVRKQLLVRGASTFHYGVAGARPSAPELFVTRPVIYEHAYGGSDTRADDPREHRIDARNPVGVGFAAQAEHGQPAPSIFYPRGAPQRVGPAGFGALASHWSPRLELAGTYDEDWVESRRPLLPLDYSPECSMCSPRDQRPNARLRGGEPLTLVNLTPEGILALRLPETKLHAQTRIRQRLVEHDFELATIVIDADARRLVMVWQAALGVAARDVDHVIRTRVHAHRQEQRAHARA